MKIKGMLPYADKATEVAISVRFDQIDSDDYAVIYNLRTEQARIVWRGHESEMRLEDDECMEIHAFVRNHFAITSDIANLIHENDVTVWDDHLENSYQGVALQDTDTVKYNGWFDRVLAMERQLKKLLTV